MAKIQKLERNRQAQFLSLLLDYRVLNSISRSPLICTCVTLRPRFFVPEHLLGSSSLLEGVEIGLPSYWLHTRHSWSSLLPPDSCTDRRSNMSACPTC